MQSKNKRIKLAYITPQYSPEFGGPWHNLFLELSKYVDVYCIAQPQIFSKDLREEIHINKNFMVIRFKSKNFRLRRELMIPIDLKKILDKIQPDIVQSDEFFRFTTIQGARWAKKNKVPFILSSRMKYRKGLVRNFGIWLFSKMPKNKFVVKYASKIISTQGDCSKKEFLKWFPNAEKKIVIIPSGLNIESFKRGVSDKNLDLGDKKIILNVSRIDSMKRLWMLIKIFSKVNKEVPDSLLVHIGSKNNEKECKKIKKEIGKNSLQEKVIFVGPIENKFLGNYYKIADIFANTSVGEGICFSFLEAMAFKVPIVAFNQGGNYCSIENGKNGFLINNDNKEEFANKIIKILKESNLKKKLGEGGWKKLNREFNIKKNAKKYVEIYRRVLNQHSIFTLNGKNKQ